MVTFTHQADGELWTRTIGGRRLNSFQSLGKGCDQHLLVERFGVARVSIALVRDGSRLFFVPRRWSILKIPMPKFLLPTGESFETEIDGQFAFDIPIRVPLLGLIVAYSGILNSEENVAV